jgi:hypothetical protein
VDFATLEAASNEAARQASSGAAPSVVRETLLGIGAGAEVAGLRVHPWTLGIALLLEQIQHPELTGGKPGMTDNAAAIFIFCEPEAAQAALQASRATFDHAVFQFALERVPVDAIELLKAAIREQIVRGKKAMPGQHIGEGGAEGGDEDPLAASRPATPGSAGN